jgi:hypothetical protein
MMQRKNIYCHGSTEERIQMALLLAIFFMATVLRRTLLPLCIWYHFMFNPLTNILKQLKQHAGNGALPGFNSVSNQSA